MTRAGYRDYDPPIPDERGIITNCHFCVGKGRGRVCNALDDFYNADKGEFNRLCANCPFFKTDREFWDKFHGVE